MQETISTQAEYNGWTNQETWLGNLWLCNDQLHYYVLMSAIRDCASRELAAQYIKDQLREQLESEVDEASIWRDLLTLAYDRIDWLEIVNSNAEELLED